MTTIRPDSDLLTALNPAQLAANIQARWFAVNSRDMSFKDCIEEELVRAIERIEQSKDNRVTEQL
jgi:hypothetical protein